MLIWMTTKKPDIRSYCNPTRLLSKDTQLAKLTGEPYVEDRKGQVIEGLIRSVRKGTIVEVVELGLLAPGKTTAKIGPAKKRKMLADRVERIMEKGGIIVEVRTDLRSDKHLPRMMVRASEFIATSGRAESQHSRGNPILLAPAEFEKAKMVWRSREHKNDKERVVAIEAAIGRKLKRSWCWQQWGSPSGRKSNA